MPQHVLDTLTPAGGHRWPIVEDTYFKGGFRVVTDMAARDVLYTDSEFREGLKPGSLVLCWAEKLTWIYLGETVDKKASWELYVPNSFVYKHVQETESAVWTISHGRKCLTIVPTTWIAGKIVVPSEIEVIDEDTVRVTFPVPKAGQCILQLYYGV